MDFIGSAFVVVLLACSGFGLAMRAVGRRDIPDNIGKGMISWFFRRML